MAIEITSGDIFTPEQLTKHSKIYAGPGAGKTHFLVENVKNIVLTNPLIAQSHVRKVLCITYTNAAVDEIKRRLDRFTEYVEAYTIHGFIIEHIIKPFQQDLRDLMQDDFGITVSDKGTISSQVEGLGILHGINKEEIYEFIKRTNPAEFDNDPFEYSKKDMGDTEVDNEAFVSSVINKTPGGMKLKVSKKIDERHKKPLKQYIWSIVKKLTHNEILYFGYRILERNPTALYATRVKFPFVFVDEFQDTSPVQTLLIKLIGEKSTVIGIVGDVAQSIYSFQGAKPTDFDRFSIDGDRELVEYAINGNKRSTENVVNFCNFLRQSDKAVTQISVRPYKDKTSKSLSESKKIHFVVGDSPAIHGIIYDAIKDGAVVLTRAWAAAFVYIDGVDEKQVKLLKDIYNSYYNSPIQLRDEIAEHNNVTWVRAFRFIFSLWEGYTSGSFIDVIRALKLCVDIDVRKLTPKIVFQIRKLSDAVFDEVISQSLTVQVIELFNQEIVKEEYTELNKAFFGFDFTIPLFNELDRDKLKDSVNALTWDTSYKLFNEVFSENSKYMTVHQAKGLEWEKVIVSVTPNRNDKTNLASLYTNPKLVEENPAEEFARMYYVACSRAKDDLYIHVLDECKNIIETSIKAFEATTGQTINYEIVSI
jgi:DNA helicase-2/ATP-dependent DNA helicase PcrA